MNPIGYLQETINELKLVQWPTREVTVRLTLTVIAVSAIMAIYVGGLDFGFTNLLKFLLQQ